MMINHDPSISIDTLFSLIDCNTGDVMHPTRYRIDKIDVLSGFICLYFVENAEMNGEENFNRFVMMFYSSNIKPFLKLIDEMYFKKSSIKTKKDFLVVLQFPASDGSGMDMWRCNLLGGIINEEKMNLLMKWEYCTEDNDKALSEIETVSKSNEMIKLESSMNNIKDKIGFGGFNEKWLDKLGMVDGQTFDREKLAMKALSYEVIDGQVWKKLTKDYHVCFTINSDKGKILAEKISNFLGASKIKDILIK